MNKEYKNSNDLEKLSAIMKGLIEYKQEIETLEKLILKYPKETAKIFGYKCDGYKWFAAYA